MKKGRDAGIYFISSLLIILFIIISDKSVAQCASPINTFPYSENFENSNGNWMTGGSGSDWAWGKPTKPVISAAASGNNCWVTAGLNTVGYNDNERGWLQSPCFDFTSLKNPSIAFNVFWETERQFDGASLQYSVDKGNTWQTAGSYNDNGCGNANWYNTPSITYMTGGTSAAGWSGNIQQPSGNCKAGGGSGQWLKAKHTLPSLAGKPNVIFRFMFVAGSTCNAYDGFAIDDILIQDVTPAITVNTQIKNISCPDGSDGTITINASGGTMPYTFSWDPSVGNSSTENNLSANTYTITVTDAGNCQAAASATVMQPSAFSAAVNTTTTTCRQNDGTATINVTGGTSPYNYAWDVLRTSDTVSIGNTGLSNKINTLAPGNYIAKITDTKGCSFTSTDFTITEQSPLTISLGADTILCPNTQLTLSPGNFASYLWQDNSVLSTYTVTSPGTYSVKVIDNNGCAASASIQVGQGYCNGFYFPTAFTPNSDGRNDNFGINGVAGPIKDYHLTIYDRWGQIVFQSSNPGEKWDGKVDGISIANQSFVWIAIFTVNNQKKQLHGNVVVIN